LLSLGASVVSGDIQAPTATEEGETPAPLFVQTNVSVWSDLTALFKKAKEQHGRIDYVFANAGIGPRANYLELETDDNGELKEPARDVLDVNLISVVNTASLAIHFIKQQAEGGSIVLMGSSTGLQPLRAPDYCKSERTTVSLVGYTKLTQVYSHGQTRRPGIWKRLCPDC
jgi:NAD(P)-dependent dehydrogenase (short-subunit alcohol dehydrogenase family)